ncbi:MAG: hypothetical protein JSR91_23290 [Proteobacteria bacterium]|nr:hypothetical protein [Pseudomonadota bacterium]
MRHPVRGLCLLGLIVLALAGCVPTPKPFAHSESEDRAYAPKEDKSDVVVLPPENMPAELGRRVAAALAMELQAYGIVGTLRRNGADATVSARMSTRDAPLGLGVEIDVDWVMKGRGGVVGPTTTKTVARPEDYATANDRLASRIAQQAAPRVATMLGRPPDYEARSLGQVAAGLSVPPVPLSDTSTKPDAAATTAAAAEPGAKPARTAAPAAPTPPQVRAVVAPVTGAPSDGNRQLLSGMRRALGSSRVVVVDKPGTDVFTVVGSVALKPIDDRSAQLSITWVLKDPNGKEVGKVEQSNPVPLAATRGSWAGFGDIVAAAAVEGILELIDKAREKQH